jgi:hypothetical protein
MYPIAVLIHKPDFLYGRRDTYDSLSPGTLIKRVLCTPEKSLRKWDLGPRLSSRQTEKSRTGNPMSSGGS